MKKFFFLFTIVFFNHFFGQAQDFSYGVITREELDLKECPFDKDANAVVLMDEAKSDYDDEGHLITDHHVKIKILKEKGFDAANVEIYYYRKDDFEDILKLQAMIINADATGKLVMEELSSKSFYRKTENERLGKMIFTFPGVKVGSIIEYKYQSFMKNYNGLRDWYFQQYFPILHSRFTVRVEPHLEFAYRVNKRPDFPIVLKQETGSDLVYFEMNNIPGLSNETYMDSREDYLQKVIFQLSGFNNGFGKSNYMTSWDEVIKELLLDKNFGLLLNKNIGGTKELMDAVKTKATEEEKMAIVYNYVRANMSWNGIYSKYAMEGVKDTWSKKKGTSGEVNLVLVNLLKDADLEVYPVLVSERFNGKVAVDYPFVDQFNNVFACVVIKGKKYYLDATDAYTPAQMTPNDILNTTALIVNRKNGGLVNISNDSLKYNDFISSQVELDDKGILSGETYISARDYARVKRVHDFKEKGKEKYIAGLYQKNGITVNDFEFLNENNDSIPSEEKFKFNTSLAVGGDYLYMPINIFSEFDNNPFISDNRFSNVNFGYKRTITTNMVVSLPKNYVIDALPKTITMSTPDKDIVFNRSVSYDKENNQVICMLVFDFKKSLYTYDEYPMLKEVFKKMFTYLKEPVVLKKK